ncbi:hypothetical protein [Oryzibacter oryziterrae]|uniref:hypothetical protein n=1 Tax=Oryzibacter oryziterrae TaxID=2766474 RepID=UPI001F439885|nr:hypothetical protein [Oryzibacter oryziterrae]
MNSKQPALPQAFEIARPHVPPAFLVALVVIGYAILLAVPAWLASVHDGWSDPDAMMRMTEVRELLAGQGWYNMNEARLMPPLGMISHWSRYIDAPLAGMILALEPFVGRSQAELLTLNLWPPFLFLPFAAGVIAVARRFGGWTAAGCALLLTALSPQVTALFKPGDIDHHNVQAILLVWLLAGLVRADLSLRWAAFAGAMAASSLAIGMETLLAVVLAAGGLAIAWVHNGDRWRRALATFGLSLAVVTTVHFFANVGPDRWLAGACDNLSIVYVMLAGLGGFGTAVIGLVFRGRNDGVPGMLMRGGALASLACLLITLTAVFYPACLHGPYGQVDPRLGPIWLDHVSEAQSIAQTLVNQPWLIPPLYLTIFLAILFSLNALRRMPGEERYAYGIVLSIVVGSLAIGLIQLRALVGAQVVASASVGVAASLVFSRTAGRNDSSAVLSRWSWLLTAPMLWYIAVIPLEKLMNKTSPGAVDQAEASCQAVMGTALETLPKGLVVSTSNFGSFLLYRTEHAVLSAPYHRDAAGILAAQAIFASPDGAAETASVGGTYLAVCLSDPELTMIAKDSPSSLAASLIAGKAPAWLEPLTVADGTAVYRVRGAAAGSADVTGSLPALGLRDSLFD